MSKQRNRAVDEPVSKTKNSDLIEDAEKEKSIEFLVDMSSDNAYFHRQSGVLRPIQHIINPLQKSKAQ